MANDAEVSQYVNETRNQTESFLPRIVLSDQSDGYRIHSALCIAAKHFAELSIHDAPNVDTDAWEIAMGNARECLALATVVYDEIKRLHNSASL